MKLGKYKGLTVNAPNLTVSDKEVEQVLLRVQRENAVSYTIDDRGAAWGDEAIIDFSSTSGGRSIPNGARENYRLRLGSGTFVRGVEEAIVGHLPGDELRVPVIFPENYPLEKLAGKKAEFSLRLKALYLPEYQPIDDDFARDFSHHESLAAWQEEIRRELEERREISAREKLCRELLNQIIADSRIPVDRGLLQDVYDSLYEDFLFSLEENGMTFEEYLKSANLTKQELRAEKKKEARQLIESEAVLHAIAQREGLRVDEEELAAELALIASEEGEEPEVFVTMLDEEELEAVADQLLMNKALELVLAQANLVS